MAFIGRKGGPRVEKPVKPEKPIKVWCGATSSELRRRDRGSVLSGKPLGGGYFFDKPFGVRYSDRVTHDDRGLANLFKQKPVDMGSPEQLANGPESVFVGVAHEKSPQELVALVEFGSRRQATVHALPTFARKNRGLVAEIKTHLADVMPGFRRVTVKQCAGIGFTNESDKTRRLVITPVDVKAQRALVANMNAAARKRLIRATVKKFKTSKPVVGTTTAVKVAAARTRATRTWRNGVAVWRYMATEVKAAADRAKTKKAQKPGSPK